MDSLKWWQKAVFYQIYPRSFADGNGDGIGDIPGIIEKLDYLKDLGVDALWLSPHYPSPLIDCGYDVADYTAVAPEYGSLNDFRRFLDEAHQRGLRVILDLVLNHTSHLNAWFQDSRSSRDHPRRDWYVWRDGHNGGPPNNWVSTFGGSAWEFDPLSGQYYYHFFFKEQPDLNWRNPEVKQAMFNVVRYWLDMGVDGFRLDAIGTVYEDERLLDHTALLSQAELYHTTHTSKNPEDLLRLNEEHQRMYGYQIDQPATHDLMQELRQVVDEYPDRVLVGETDDIAYYGDGTNELHMVFNFPLMRTDRLTAPWVRANQKLRLESLPSAAWPCNTLGNHDVSRVYSRFADGSHNEAIARAALALMLTLRGTPFLYNGEEIGMGDYFLKDLSEIRDTLSLWVYHLEKDLLGAAPEDAFDYALRYGRDKCRTPFQWANRANAGFSPAHTTPWLPVNPNYALGVNVEEQEKNSDSLLHFYRRLLHLRKETPALIAGEYRSLDDDSPFYLGYLRSLPEQKCLVFLNLSEREQKVHSLSLQDQLNALSHPSWKVLFSNERPTGTILEEAALTLSPFEILILELTA